MKSFRLTFLVILFTVLILTGCQSLYIPNVVNTPLFSNKGEAQAAVHFGTAGIDPQLAYAVTNNIGIMLNGSFDTFETVDTTEVFPANHSFGELGIGYYTKVTEKHRFEVYAGYGIGNIKFEEYDLNNTPIQSKVNTNRFFIQPAFGLTSKNFDFSVASRIIWISGKGDVESYTRSFWEPAVTVRAGGPHIKGVMQFGLSVPFKDDFFEYEPVLFSIGIQGSLGKIFE